MFAMRRTARVILAVAVSLSACSDDKSPSTSSAPPPALAGLQVLPATEGPVALPVGVPVPFTAIGTFADGTTRDVTSEVVWTSSSDAVATVSNAPGAAGVATAVAVGSASLTATDPTTSLAASVAVMVLPAQVTSLAISPIDPTLLIGTTLQLRADAVLGDESDADLTTSVAWSSSDEAIVSVTQGGLVTAVALGAATITATDPISGQTATTVVQVTDLPAALSYVAASRGSVIGGGGVEIWGVAALTSVADEDVIVTITSSDDAVVAVQATVTVLAGTDRATFQIDTFEVLQRTKITITATDGTTTKTARLNVRKPRPIK